MVLWFVGQPGSFTNLDLSIQSAEAFIASRPDPNFIFLGFHTTEILVSLIVAVGLAFVVKRSRRLIESRVLAERTRASLARYFSPNVVDRLSDSEHPLGGGYEQEVAVLFADIMDFTKLCESHAPEEVIALLSDYHNRLGRAVFDNGGTLDKYMGDGLITTFGTPEPGPHDARHALQYALDMIAALAAWNGERSAAGVPPVRVGIGVHYGPAIAGDIGNERKLEYSVIGDTVNSASHLEQWMCSLNASLVVSYSLVKAVGRDLEEGGRLLETLSEAGMQTIRGRDSGLTVWVLKGGKSVPAIPS